MYITCFNSANATHYKYLIAQRVELIWFNNKGSVLMMDGKVIIFLFVSVIVINSAVLDVSQNNDVVQIIKNEYKLDEDGGYSFE